jgi:hypothetical protein
LRGEPTASDEPKLLGNTDTIIERLDGSWSTFLISN